MDTADYKCTACGRIWRGVEVIPNRSCKNCSAPCVIMEPEPDLRLRLTLDIAYDTAGEHQQLLIGYLEAIPKIAAADGYMTNDSGATVEEWKAKVHVLGTDSQSPLLEEWLGAVNQPVVEDALHRIRELLGVVSDGDNFTEEQCKEILIEVLTHPKVLKAESPHL